MRTLLSAYSDTVVCLRTISLNHQHLLRFSIFAAYELYFPEVLLTIWTLSHWCAPQHHLLIVLLIVSVLSIRSASIIEVFLNIIILDVLLRPDQDNEEMEVLGEEWGMRLNRRYSYKMSPDKTSKDITSLDKMSQLHNVPNLKLQIQNVRSLEASQATKCPNHKMSQIVKCPNLKTSQAPQHPKPQNILNPNCPKPQKNVPSIKRSQYKTSQASKCPHTPG